MKPGIIYGGTFVFAFVIVTGMIIYLNSTYENIFQFNFAPKSVMINSDSNKPDSLMVTNNDVNVTQSDSTIAQDSILLSSLGGVEENDSMNVDKNDSGNVKTQPDNSIPQKQNEITDTTPQTKLTTNQQLDVTPETQNGVQDKEYTVWVKKITSIYSSMEPKKAAKIIQTYSDNVARDILYNMNKKTAAKVVSEFSPETANRIFRFE